MVLTPRVGVFDEESCRFFLREVGEKVVPAYPFDYGMEEAYSLILERYGYDGIADAISLLQDLLEEDDVATGIGDDGDIWRSWRHPWRRRNHRGLNPWIPHIGHFVLPPPTPKHVRKMKADNFLRQSKCREPSICEPGKDLKDQASTNGSTGEASMPDSAVQFQSMKAAPDEINGASTTRTTYSHQRCRLGHPHFDDSVRDNQEPKAFQYQPQSPGASTRKNAASRQSSNRAKTPVTVGRQYAGTDTSSQLGSPSRHSMSDRELWPRPPTTGSRGSDTFALPDASHVKPPSKKVRFSRLSCSADIISEEDVTYPTQTTSGQNTPDAARGLRQSMLSQNDETCGTPDPQRKATNRSASLVDGIFRNRSNGSESEGESRVTDAQESKRSSRSLTWKAWHSKGSKRGSLAEGVKSLFGATKGNKSNVLIKHRHTTDFGQEDKPAQWRGHKRNLSNTLIAPAMPGRNLDLMLDGPYDDYTPAASATPPRKPRFMLDGACDDSDSASSPPPRNLRFLLDGACDDQISTTSSGSYLNKPLPLTPEYIAQSLASRKRTKSFSHTFSLPQDPPAASTTSTKTRTFGKDEFQALTSDLVQSGSMKPFELCPVREVDARYRRQRANVARENTQPLPPTAYNSIAQRNPFLHDPAPPTPAPSFLNTQHPPKAEDGRFSFGLPASQSEPNLSCRISSPPPPVPMFFDAEGLAQSPPSSSPELPEGKKSKSRGRSDIRKDLNSMDGTMEEVRSVERPTKRSQSPVKRILGLTRSKSKSRPQTPSSSPEKVNNPNSSSKRSFKQWTNKFRHGFLTADQEEIQREAQMEGYMEQSSKPSVPTDPPSTFPISLDPAHQARLQADMELMIVVSANRFLLKEAEAGRLAPSTVSATRREWEKQNLPQVLEYLYDQAAQRELIVANLQTLNFCGSVSHDAVGLSSTLYNWGVLAREMRIRTFCAGDSVIRKWLHDARRVLELLGAPLITFLAFQDLEVKTHARITQRQHQRAERITVEDQSRNVSASSRMSPIPRRDWSAASNYGITHRRNISDGSRKYSELPAGLEYLNLTPTQSPRYSNSVKSRKPTVMPGIPKHGHSSSTGDVYDMSRGGPLGRTVQTSQQLVPQPLAPHEHSRLPYATTTPTRTPRMPPMPVITPTSMPKRRHEVEGEVSLKKVLWPHRYGG